MTETNLIMGSNGTPSRKHRRIYFSIVLVLLIGAAGAFAWLQYDGSAFKKTGATLRELNAEWNEYTNYDLGFSLQVPKQNYQRVGDVMNRTISVPVKVIEDAEAGVVYITDAWEIDRYGNKVKDTTLQDLQKQFPIAWKITIKHVPNAVSLLHFIRERYYPGCGIQSLEPSKIEGVYNLETTHAPPDDESEGYCFINWATINKYSPTQQKIANWDIGQDVVFSGPDFETLSYDAQMTDSFRFLE